MKFQNLKQVISVAIVATFTLSCPSALAASEQQLDNLSLAEVLVVYNYEIRSAKIVIEHCNQLAETEPIMKGSCDLQLQQWQNYFTQFQFYIQKRRLIESRN